MPTIESQGSKVYFSTTTSFSTNIDVGNVVGFSGPQGSANVIDVTHLGSTMREKRMGLPDEGSITFDLLSNLSDTGQTKMRECRAARTKCLVGILLNDTRVTLVTMEGYVTGYAVSGAVDDVVKTAVTFEISGAASWSTRAA